MIIYFNNIIDFGPEPIQQEGVRAGPPDTGLTRLPVPGKYFSKNQYRDHLSELRKEAKFNRELLAGLSDLAKAEMVFADAEREIKETESRLESQYNRTNYDKYLGAQGRKQEAQAHLDALLRDDGRD